MQTYTNTAFIADNTVHAPASGRETVFADSGLAQAAATDNAATQASTTEAAATQAAASEPPRCRTRGWRERIWVAEDDAGLQQTLCFTLSRLGYDVRVVGNGQDALRTWRAATCEERPQLLLTAVEMPGLNGIELLRLVRVDEPNLPVIVMTSSGSNAALVHALRLHADDFVLKPLELVELKTALDRALRARRQRVALETERTRAARLQAVLETATAVNHEINNPLAAISASAQLLRHQLQNPAASPDAQTPAPSDDAHRSHQAANAKRAAEAEAANVEAANVEAALEMLPEAAPEPDAHAVRHLLDVIIEQCERIADFNRRLNGVVNPVTRSSGGRQMLDIEHSC